MIFKNPKKIIILRFLYYLQGILSLAEFLSLQQKQETPQAMTIIKITETHPTMSNNLRLI